MLSCAIVFPDQACVKLCHAEAAVLDSTKSREIFIHLCICLVMRATQ